MAERDFNEVVERAKRHPSPLAIGGAVAIGAVVGSFIPVIGTAIGAGIGGIIGGVGVIIKEIKK
ncbi:MAG: hypothetical protein Ta2B_20350 [Termitinemataceae bacterium]|nr:MAG: hypothetical protein Ta2B_20350 [Termitinemataceae bacterium]